MKTFNWMPATGNAAGDELLVKKIKNAVDAELQAKGRAPAEASPDFLIGMQLSGRTTYGGDVIVNTSGGLKAAGHPVGATGIKQAVELTWQLRGDAGERQAKDINVALSHNVGGSGATAVVHIYKRGY